MSNESFNEPILDPAATAEAKSKLDSGRDHAKAAASELKSAADVLKQAATEKAGELKTAATAKAQEIKETASAKAAEYRDLASEKWSQAREKSRTFQDDGEEYIRANPTRSVLTALAAGFVLGLALRK